MTDYVFQDIDLRMPVDSRTGDVKLAVDHHAVNQRLANAILTEIGEIPYEYLVGTDVSVALFEVGWVSADVISDSVEKAVNDMFNEIDLIAIKVEEEQPHALNVIIVYKIRPHQAEKRFEMKLRLQ